MIDVADFDRDGRITQEEFYTFMCDKKDDWWIKWDGKEAGKKHSKLV